MASMHFDYIYILNESSVLGLLYEDRTVIVSNGDTLSEGDLVVSDPVVPEDQFFLYASDDGFVCSTNPFNLWFTNTERTPGDVASDDGSSFVVCFVAGTRIATPAGWASVEDLRIGDLVLTADGRAAPVCWVGMQTVVSFFADPLHAFPVRIAAGALGEGLPVRDLLVSPDHALLIDGTLVQAGALVNGTTIVRETSMPDRFTYYHVELDDHALILAEGVTAETFVDNVTRRRFDNFAEYEALYGDTAAVIAEMAVPRVKSARQLPKGLRARLAARAAVAGGAPGLAA